MQDVNSYLFSKDFFIIGLNVFHEIIGIPMGRHPAPVFVNHFSCYDETKWMDSLIKNGIITAVKNCVIF